MVLLVISILAGLVGLGIALWMLMGGQRRAETDKHLTLVRAQRTSAEPLNPCVEISR